ncbi:hypothetical protein ACO0QE_002535 [Hanseniaspora vineae]
MKRPHSPEYAQSQYLSARNYKRQKLLQDFENMTISPYQSKKKIFKKGLPNSGSNVYGVGSSEELLKNSGLAISKNVLSELQNFIELRVKNGSSLKDSKFIESVRAKIIESNMQMVRYVCMSKFLYEQWKKWFLLKNPFHAVFNDFNMEVDANNTQDDDDVEMMDV